MPWGWTSNMMELLSDPTLEKWESDIQILSPALLMTCSADSRERIKYLFLQVLVWNGKYLTFSVNI